MAATSLKLSDELKRRISALVKDSDRTAHAFMIEAIEQAAKREELRRRFGAEAARAEEETESSGQAYSAPEIFDWFEARAAGKKRRKPKAVKWQRSA